MPPQYVKTCRKCERIFETIAFNRKTCPDCCKCKRCGKPMQDASHEFCSGRCAGKWRWEHNKISDAAIATRFASGQSRGFIKLCIQCEVEFYAKSGSRKWCPDCCRCEWCGIQLPNGSDRFCGNSCAGKWKYQNSCKVREAIALGKSWTTNPTLAAKRVAKLSAARTGKPRYDMRGPNNPNWTGGQKREQRHVEMGRVEYKNWRTAVYKRDGFKCVACGTNQRLNANHIYPWRDHPERRYDVDNGITLCEEHHRAIHGCELEFAEVFNYIVSARNEALTYP